MAYRFRKSDVSVEQAVRRIALEQIDGALALIRDEPDRAEAVHGVRLCCKKLRGLLRLVRPVFDGYAAENAAFRDLARMLSGLRDAKVLQDTFDGLVDRYADEVDSFVLASAREGLSLLGNGEAEPTATADPLEQCLSRLTAARERAADWRLDESGWRALGPGLAKTCAQAGKAAGHAREEGGTVAYHELRKRLKYHWYHTRLFRGLWPELMEVRAATGRQVSDLLGEHHDLCVFEARVGEYRDAFATTHEADVILSLARRRKEELEGQAWPLIGRLLAQPPKALEEYWGALWAIWQAGDRLSDPEAGD
ncbi:MAG: CHAD domain-containing protein [Novosphingobium sp.]|nr:CHAD domain-containing protein [Novosphingobium sp.]